jgi:hypothetical protein
MKNMSGQEDKQASLHGFLEAIRELAPRLKEADEIKDFNEREAFLRRMTDELRDGHPEIFTSLVAAHGNGLPLYITFESAFDAACARTSTRPKKRKRCPTLSSFGHCLRRSKKHPFPTARRHSSLHGLLCSLGCAQGLALTKWKSFVSTYPLNSGREAGRQRRSDAPHSAQSMPGRMEPYGRASTPS